MDCHLTGRLRDPRNSDGFSESPAAKHHRSPPFNEGDGAWAREPWEVRGDRRGPRSHIKHDRYVQGRIRPRFRRSPSAAALANFAREAAWPTRSIWRAQCGRHRRRAGHRPRDRRAVSRLRRGGRDLGSRRRAGRQRPPPSCEARGRVAAFAVDVTKLADVERARDATRQGARPHRHPGQQCRHRRPEREDLGISARRRGREVMRGQPRRPVPLLPRRRAADDRAELRPHRQHRLDRRQGRQPERAGLFGLEGRRDRADQIARQGARRLRHRGQLHHAGGGQDRDLRPDDASSISTTCCRRSRAAASSRSRRSRRWSRSAPRPTARSPPARCSTFPAAGRPIDRSPAARAAPRSG